MKQFTGKGVYGAVAMGKISLFKKQDTVIQRTSVTDTEAEKARVEAAKAAASEQLQAIYEKALKEVGETNAQIFEIHMMMLEDDDYNESIQNIIDTQKVNAEYAVSITADNFAEMFSAMDDAYMQARAADVRDISDRIIANLTGNVAVQEDSDEKRIICADDLAPSETVSLDKDKVLAFVTAHGSSNSHTAILARNMNIPAVIGVGSDFLKEVQDGTEAIVDGFTGEIFVEPDEETRQRLLEKQRADEEKKRLLLELKGKENTLACDRQNPDIEPFIDTHHEAILRLIEMSAKNAHANGAWIGICGELAADTTLTETFLRMGIDELSVSPAFVLKVRDAVRNVDLRK